MYELGGMAKGPGAANPHPSIVNIDTNNEYKNTYISRVDDNIAEVIGGILGLCIR